MKVYLVRHAETIENVKGFIMGHQHGTISQGGIRQAELIAQKLKDTHFDIARSSDLSRAEYTANVLLKYHPDTKLKLSKELREIDFGKFTGRSKHKVNWEDFPDGGEGLQDIQKRAKVFLDKLYKFHSEKSILLVSHNGFNKAILTILMGKDAKHMDELENQHPTALNIFSVTNSNEYILEVMNNVDHLS